MFHSPEHHIGNQEWLTMIKYRLHLDIVPDNIKCKSCKTIVDSKGLHLLHCKLSKTIQIHDTIRNIFGTMCQELGYFVRVGEIPFALNPSSAIRINPYPDFPETHTNMNVTAVDDECSFIPPPIQDINNSLPNDNNNDNNNHEMYNNCSNNNNDNDENYANNQAHMDTTTATDTYDQNSSSIPLSKQNPILGRAKNDHNTSNTHTHADIIIQKLNENPTYMDIQIKDPTNSTLEAAEKIKENRYLPLAKLSGSAFFAPTFDVFGNPSKKTEEYVKNLFDQKVKSLTGDSRIIRIRSGRPLNYWFTKISFTINYFKAMQTNRLLNNIVTDMMESEKIVLSQTECDRLDDQLFMRRHKT